MHAVVKNNKRDAKYKAKGATTFMQDHRSITPDADTVKKDLKPIGWIADKFKDTSAKQITNAK